MKITTQTVLDVAKLANLELTPEEQARFVKDLNSILDYIDRLNQLDTSNAPPMIQIAERGAPLAANASDRFAYAQRPDTPQPCLPHEDALKNAPATDGNFFKVPKVIEK